MRTTTGFGGNPESAWSVWPALWLCILLLAPASPAGGRASGPLRVVQIQGTDYVSLIGVAEAAGGALEWSSPSQKITLRLDKGQFLITPGSAYVSAGGRGVRMAAPALRLDGSIYVPAHAFLPMVEHLVPGRIQLGEAVKIDGARTTKVPQQAVPPAEPGPGGPSRSGPVGKGGSSAGEPIVAIGSGGVPKAGNAPGPPPVLPSSTENQASSESGRGASPWMLHTVVIDPGHGGKDVGAVGPTGLQEKQVALEVALRLGRLIEDRLGIKAVLTRSTDKFVPLMVRARTALETDGSLFISLHCNSVKRQSRSVRGTEVYFLSEAKTDEAREVARRENAALSFETEETEGLSADNSVIWSIFEGMHSDQFLKESQDLAAEVLAAIAKRGGLLRQRGVRQAGFHVMKSTQARMPSILIEMGFISNPIEERLLKRKSFQMQLGEAIFEGVQRFKAKAEREVVTDRWK